MLPSACGAFDVLIVDEAAQAMEAETLVPLQCAPKQCLLVGDPQQLPALVTDPLAHRLLLGRSLMERLMYRAELPYRMLDEQYRMHPEISRFPSRRYYKGELKDDASVRGRDVYDAVAGCAPWIRPYLLLDVAQGREQQSRGSCCNAEEARMVPALLDVLARGLCVGRQVVVITFYAAQVSGIRRALGRRYREVPVHTVDSYQGSEADVVIVSFVRANARHRVGFLKDYRRMNVAITRARACLLLLGHAETLGNCPVEDLSALVADARERGRIVPSTVVDGADTRAREAGRREDRREDRRERQRRR